MHGKIDGYPYIFEVQQNTLDPTIFSEREIEKGFQMKQSRIVSTSYKTGSGNYGLPV
jgi:hypothetical protein